MYTYLAAGCHTYGRGHLQIYTKRWKPEQARARANYGLTGSHRGPSCWRVLLGLHILLSGMHTAVEPVTTGDGWVMCSTAGGASSKSMIGEGSARGCLCWHLALKQLQRLQLAASVVPRLLG